MIYKEFGGYLFCPLCGGRVDDTEHGCPSCNTATKKEPEEPKPEEPKIIPDPVVIASKPTRPRRTKMPKPPDGHSVTCGIPMSQLRHHPGKVVWRHVECGGELKLCSKRKGRYFYSWYLCVKCDTKFHSQRIPEEKQ